MSQMVDGRYRLDEVIGSGGMATVWRAHDTQLDRTVAVKRPHPLPPGDPRFDRLAREARLAASVSHPNLVEVHDAGSDDGGLFLEMEFIDAPSLGEVGGSFDRRQTLSAGSEVARALAAVHAANVVHRDVKPSNVLLPPTGAKLLDFGVALTGNPMPGFEPTVAGVVFGTKGYAAPEVLAREPATAASDVFAVGVMMYELLSGERPSAEGNWTVNAPVLDDPAGDFVARCLALDPTERPSAATTAEALAQLAAEPNRFAPAAGGVSYDRTEVMAPPTVAAAPVSPAPPPLAQDTPGRSGGNIGWAVLAGIVLVAVVGFVINRSITGEATPEASGSLPVPTVATAVATTNVPPSTAPPTTTTTTAPTTTAADPLADVNAAFAALGSDSVDDEQAEALAYETLREGLRGNGRNNDVAEKVAKKVGEAVKENRDDKPDEALKKLEDGAEEAAKNLDGFARVWALAVLDTAARQMDLGEPEFSIQFDPTNPLNDDDDDDDD